MSEKNPVLVNLNNVRHVGDFTQRLSVDDLLKNEDHINFIKVINQERDNPVPRLIHADWLQEAGLDEHAEAIREDANGKHTQENYKKIKQIPYLFPLAQIKATDLKRKIMSAHGLAGHIVFTLHDATYSKGHGARSAESWLKTRPDSVFVYTDGAPTKLGFSYSSSPTKIMLYRKSSGGKWGRSANGSYVKSKLFDHS